MGPLNGRDSLIEELRTRKRFDLLIIGGGATGLGTAVEAASRGLSVALVERRDFCHGTSSRSTKLVHGGVRYLAQANLSLVFEALRERGRLLRNAPHLCRRLPLIVPAYRRRDGIYYAVGLGIYDLMSGWHSLGRTRLLSPAQVQKRLPAVRSRGLRGGVLFYDGQFDDARLGIALALRARELGALPLNYVAVEALLLAQNRVAGARLRDVLSGESMEVEADVTVNATGEGADAIRKMADAGAAPRLVLSRGSHIVLPGDLLGGDTALLVPKTEDGRVLFAIPWQGRTLAGTTDVPVETAEDEPVPSTAEIDFILEHLNRYFDRKVDRTDILSVFAGLRPLVRQSGGGAGDTAALSRDHALEVLHGNLVSIMGGKWTTYRRMAEDTVDRAIRIGRLRAGPSVTADLDLGGAEKDGTRPFAAYGEDAPALQALVHESPELGELLHRALPCRKVEIVWAARREWACRLEDALARRTRCLFLDARASMEAAPEAARLMGETLARDQDWMDRQVSEYQALARKYLPG